MSEIVATIKAGAGYADPWIVFHGATVAEVADQVSAATEAGLMAVVKAAAVSFAAQSVATETLGASPVVPPQAYAGAPNADSGWPTPAPAAPPVSQYGQASAPVGPNCPHGAMKYVKAGISKAGKEYNAFFACPERGTSCRTQSA